MDETIGAIAERELGATPEAVTRTAEGLVHETVVLRCSSEEYVLQVAPDEAEDRDDALERGLGCYRLLGDTGVPVPGVVTETVRILDGRRYVLVEKLPGSTGERDISPERARNAGRVLARIHAVQRFDATGWVAFDGYTPTVDEFEAGGLRERVQRRVERSASAFRDDAELASVGAALERLQGQLVGAVPDAFEPVLCHNDFSPDNLLFDGGEVTGVLDFDRAWASHAQRDLVKAANGFWMHDPAADWNPREAFYEGYRAERPLGEQFEKREPRYRVETLAGTVAGLLEMDELSEYERECYADRLLAAIDRVDSD